MYKSQKLRKSWKSERTHSVENTHGNTGRKLSKSPDIILHDPPFLHDLPLCFRSSSDLGSRFWVSRNPKLFWPPSAAQKNSVFWAPQGVIQVSGGGHADLKRGSCRFQEGVMQVSGGGHADFRRGSCRFQEGVMQFSGRRRRSEKYHPNRVFTR